MAAITTAAAGNWSATGTWTGGVVPGNGDTVTLNHAVTVDVDTIIGASPIQGAAVQAIAQNVAGSLTIAEDVTLTLRGDYFLNGNFTMQAGSKVLIDSTQSAAPSTTAYYIRYSTNGGAGGVCNVYINGTTAKRCKIETAPGCRFGIFWSQLTGLVKWVETHCDWLRMGWDTGSPSVEYRFYGANASKELRVTGSTYTACNGRRTITANDASCAAIPMIFDKIEDIAPASTLTAAMYINATAPSATGLRKITNSYITKQVLVAIAGGLVDWNMDGTVFHEILLPIGGTLNGSWTGDECIFIDEKGSPRIQTTTSKSVLTDLILLGHNANNDHQEGILRQSEMDIDGAVWEVASSNTEHRVCFCGDTGTLAHPVNTVRPLVMKNVLSRPNPRGDGPGFMMMMKGSKFHRITMENCTFPMPGDNQYWHGCMKTSWGSNSRAYPDYITSYRNNLHWQPNENDEALSYGVNQLRTESSRTLTALGTSTTTVLNHLANPPGLITGTGVTNNATGEGVYRVKMTSGPDAGLVRPVVGNTTTSITVDPAFPNSMAGQTAEVFPLDSAVDVDYNAFYRCPPTGTIYGADNTAARTNVVGYDGLVQTDTAAIGANDIVSSSALMFVDDTRSIYTWATAENGLDHDAATAWVTSTAYVYGDAVSRPGGATFFEDAVLNWRCVIPHTSDSAKAPGGYLNTWQAYWLPEGLFEIIQNKLGRTGFDADATQANYLAWMREGFAPTNAELLTAGYDGGYIGAVQPVNPDVTAPILTGPTATATGPTTATASVSTDDGNGTLYFLASTNATESAATVKAALSQSVTTAGAQSISLSAIDPGTTYYVHFVQINGAGLESASVVSTAAFTTDSIAVKGATITLHAGTTPQASINNIVALWWDATTPSGAPDYSTTTASTDASGVLTLDLDATTALSIGDNGFLLLYKLDATDYRDSLVFAGRVAVSDVS